MVTITLPPELEKNITERANRQGTTPELLTLDSLNQMYIPPAFLSPIEAEETLADYWADYIGTIDSREIYPEGSQLSENTGRKFAELMMEKYRKEQP